MENNNKIPLGKEVEYQSTYNPDLLFAIARQEKRSELGIKTILPFVGEDIWNAFELSWLNDNGLPQVAIAEFRFSANSPNIIESKSFKLYLNSLNQSPFKNRAGLKQTLESDLSSFTGSKVSVSLQSVDSIESHQISSFKAVCIDAQDLKITQYDYEPQLLKLSDESRVVTESLYSNLLKSNCLITNQPDWGSVYIQYKGNKISQESLLKYLISFRTHNEFHEQCVERIYMDIMQYCKPIELTVYARYTRRGGLDINPWRSNCLKSISNIRLSRQ